MLDNLGALPIHQILSLLNPQDLSSLAQCSRNLYNSVNYNVFWKKFCFKRNWVHFGNPDKCNKCMIEYVLSSELSHFPLLNLNHDGENFKYLNPLCYWWQVYLRGVYLECNWKCGKYTLHQVSIKNFSSDKVTVMDCNDNILIIGTSSKNLLVYELYSFKYLKTINIEQQVTCLSIIFDSVVFGLANGDVCIYDCLDLIGQFSFKGEQCPVWSVLKLGDRICGIYSNGEIYIWSLSLNSLLFTLNGHSDEIFCFTSFSDKYVVTGSWDCTAIVWDIENGFLAVQLFDHIEAVSCVKMNHSYLVTGSFDGNVRIYDWQQSLLLNTLEASKEIYCIEFNKRYIVGAGSDSHIFVWNWMGNQLFKMSGHLGIIRHIKFLNDSRLISAGDMRRIMVWDVINGSCENILYRNPLQIGKCLANNFCVIVASDSATPHICVLSFL